MVTRLNPPIIISLWTADGDTQNERCVTLIVWCIAPFQRPIHFMARSYSKKDGKKVLLPTPRQIAKEAELKAQLASLAGRNTFVANMSISTQTFILREVSKMSPEHIAKVLANGKATEDYMRIKAAEAIRGVRDNPNWKGRDELMNKDSPHNISRSYNGIVRLPQEVAHVWDKDNRYLGYSTQDKASTVAINATRGSVAGGTALHNHPIASDRPLGHNASTDDFRGAKEMGLRVSHIASVEGRYSIKSPASGWDKVSTKSINTLGKKLEQAQRNAISEARKIFPNANSGDKKYMDLKSRLWHLNQSKVIQSFCQKTGVKYEFKASKKYENLTDINSVYKPLPNS